MDKEIDPSNIGKHENLIKQAQAEMAKTDVLVCGKCHNVYHFIELFKQHKDKGCTKDSSLRDCVSLSQNFTGGNQIFTILCLR